MSGDHHRSGKIPAWDNRPETFDEHLIEVDIFVRGWDHWKEPQAIAKIFRELSGDSKKRLKALSETEREKVNSKAAYKAFIRGHLLETAVPELGRAFRNWVKLRRQPKEGMRLYLQRHKQLLTRMQTTLIESNIQSQLKLKKMIVIKYRKMEIFMEEKKIAIVYARERQVQTNVDNEFSNGPDRSMEDVRG